MALGSSPFYQHWTVRLTSDGLIASAYDGDALIHSTMLPVPKSWSENDETHVSVPLLPFFVEQSVRSQAFVGLDSSLIALRPNGLLQRIDLGCTIRSILAVGNDPDIALLVATNSGGIVAWFPWKPSRIETFVSDMDRPILEPPRAAATNSLA